MINAKILCIMKHSRPYLETQASFLCTRVNLTSKEYWGKLRRVLNYMRAKKNDKRIMGSGNLIKIETWVDASH